MRRLRPYLEPVELTQGASIFCVGAPVRHVTFIDRGFISIMKTMEDGRTVEIGTNGHCDVVGMFGLLGVERATWDSVVRLSGTGFRLNKDLLKREMDNDDAVRRLLAQYTHLVLNGLAQTAACHRLHSLTQRFCRWLLAAQDAAGTDTLALTHEKLALMLGVQRSGVSIIASGFQKAGAIRSNRGSITIIDRDRLKRSVCECYGTSRRRFDRVFGAS